MCVHGHVQETSTHSTPSSSLPHVQTNTGMTPTVIHSTARFHPDAGANSHSLLAADPDCDSTGWGWKRSEGGTGLAVSQHTTAVAGQIFVASYFFRQPDHFLTCSFFVLLFSTSLPSHAAAPSPCNRFERCFITQSLSSSAYVTHPGQWDMHMSTPDL